MDQINPYRNEGFIQLLTILTRISSGSPPPIPRWVTNFTEPKPLFKSSHLFVCARTCTCKNFDFDGHVIWNFSLLIVRSQSRYHDTNNV
ncbi:hypothetical protein ABKN59_008085 [Abortiporus biennis]